MAEIWNRSRGMLRLGAVIAAWSTLASCVVAHAAQPEDMATDQEAQVEDSADDAGAAEDPTWKSLRQDPARLAKIRAEVFAFAPYASMHSRFTPAGPGGGSAAEAMTEWTRLRELNEGVFSADPALKSAYQDLRAFMIRTETQAKPLLESLKIPPLTVSLTEHPDLALVEVMFYVSAQMARNSALMDWAKQHDKTCRNAYRRIMPLVRQLGETPRDARAEESPVRVRHWFMEDRGVYIEALNESGRDLHNVTLSVRWHTIDGPSVTSYYFQPTWPKGSGDDKSHRVQLRVPTDWFDVGAAATTAMVVEVISDEHSVKPVRFEFDDHIPTAADAIIARNEARMAKKVTPALVVREMNKIDGLLASFPDRQQKVRDLKAQAKEMLDQRIAAIDDKIRASEEEARGVRENGVKEHEKSRLKRIEGEIKKLNAQRARVISGKE